MMYRTTGLINEYTCVENAEEKMNSILLALLVVFTSISPASAVDRDIDNDGVYDQDKGGSDKDTDNDGVYDADKGGSDNDLDNDGVNEQGERNEPDIKNGGVSEEAD
jgi:hypothetical protein